MSQNEEVRVSAGPVISTDMKHVMLDWETMGNKPNAAVIALGACFFDPVTGEIGAKFYSEINLSSSVAAGLDIDPSTVIWWMSQSDEARAKFKRNENAPSLRSCARQFQDWLTLSTDVSVGEIELWGNGAAFDNVIAANVFNKLGYSEEDRPWRFWGDRCYRTVKNLYPDVEYKFEGVKHFALDDAISQAKHLCAIAKKHKILGAV